MAWKPPAQVIRWAHRRPYARRTMKFTIPSAIATGILTIGVLAACGQQAQAPSDSPTQVWHELVACARAHGDPNLPDPTIDSQGQAHWPAGTAQPSTSTIAACQSIYNRLPASVRSGGPVDIQMAIKFSECMRSHGLTDWPDPQPDGSYRLPADLQIDAKTGPLWNRIKAGWDACAAFNPTGHISESR